MGFSDWCALGRKKSGKRTGRAFLRSRLGTRGVLQCEALEQRQVLSISLAPISGPDTGGVFDVPAGKNLYVPLTSTTSGVGESVTYTVSSSNPDVSVEVLSGNPTLELNVTGTDSSGTAFSGTMTVELFQNLAPNTVAQITSLVTSGFYDGLEFYRIVPSFVIQGGANGTKTVPSFADEFDPNLTFNSPGMLAMANPGTPDSNTSEFFITDIGQTLDNTPQYLNFRHSIFGQLTSGFDVYQKIMDAQGITANNSSPTSPVTITSAAIITDTQNGVVRISEAAGYTGTSSITVTAHSSDGSSDQKSFTIDAAPLTQATQEHPLLLNTVADQTTTVGNAISFQISANQLFGKTLGFSVTGDSGFTDAPSNVAVTVTPIDDSTATVTLTPAAGFAGVIHLVAHADDSADALHDAQQFSLTVIGEFAISSVSDPVNTTNVHNVTVNGNSGIGDTISVIASDGTITTPPVTTTVGSDGLWTISGIDVSVLSDGTINFTATDMTAGHVDTITAQKDTVSPSLTITSVPNPIGTSNATAVAVTGTGDPGLTVKLLVSGSMILPALETTVAANGTWTITGIDVSSLDDGTITFNASSSDSSGNVTDYASTSFLDTVAPTVAITSATDPISLANASNVSASGTGDVGVSISLVVTDGTNTTTEYTTTVDGNGNWSITGIDVSDLADGTVTFQATASDGVNTTEATQTATKSAVAISSITSPINASNADNTTVIGTGEAGAAISLVVSEGANTTTTYTTTTDQNGDWTITGVDVSALADGPITYMATATNSQQQTSEHSKTVTKDTVAPTVNVVSTTDPINLGNEAATFVNGSSEAGATISVLASDGTNTTTAVTATASDTGTWSATGIDVSTLADGTITYTITATDAAGNSTETTITTVKDTVAPTIAITEGTSPVTIANSNDITVSGTGEVGATVTVVASDGTTTTSAVTTTVGQDGTWSVTGLVVNSLIDGTITYTATITDAAFNTATDTLDASKSTIDITVVTDPVNQSNVTSVSASGTGEVGASVSVVASDGTNSTTAVTTTVGADGTWSISGIDLTALADGTITITATATDAAQEQRASDHYKFQGYGRAKRGHHFGHGPDQRCDQRGRQRYRRRGRAGDRHRFGWHDHDHFVQRDRRVRRHLVDQQYRRVGAGRRHGDIHCHHHRWRWQLEAEHDDRRQGNGNQRHAVRHGLP